MQAILLTRANLDAIIEKGTSINEFDHEALMESVKDKPNYFVPEWDDPQPDQATSWALVPEHYMDEWFTFDKELAALDFVDLTRITPKVN
jgi:hypothetical protein